MICQAKTCQYGVFSVRCGTVAATKRQRTGGGTWDLCERHAAFVDRLRANIEDHRSLLNRLRDENDPYLVEMARNRRRAELDARGWPLL